MLRTYVRLRSQGAEWTDACSVPSDRPRKRDTATQASPQHQDRWLDFACPQQTSGNPFVLTAGSQQLRGTVAATASWDEYQKKMIGKISLSQGTSEILFRSDGAPKGYLLDLRGIQLVPLP